MPQRMTGHQHYLKLQTQHSNALALVECHLSGRNGLKRRTPDLRVSVCVKLRDAAHMIEVVMGNQYVAQNPVRVPGQPLQNRRGITRVDHGTALLGSVL